MSFFTYSSDDKAIPGKEAHILFHRHKSQWMKVNKTGLEIAKRLEDGQSVEAVVFHLSKRYGIPYDIAERDVTHVCSRLKASCFLENGVKSTVSRQPSLNSIMLHLTNRCNLSCLHCCIGSPSRTPAHELPAPLVLRMLDELISRGGTTVTLSGGEPLLHPDLKLFLQHAAPRLEIRLLTNGTLIDLEWAEFLVDIGAHVQISLDGATEQIHDQIRGEGSFQKALRGLGFLQKAGIEDRVNLCTTVMKQNLVDIRGIIALARKLGVPMVRFLPLRMKGNAELKWQSIGASLGVEDYTRLFDITRRQQALAQNNVDISCGLSGFILKMPQVPENDDIWCPVGRRLVIDSEGGIYPCDLMMEDPFFLGNAYHTSLSGIIEGDDMARICRTLLERREKIRECRACTWRNLCQAGCMGQSLENRGTLWDTDNFCEYRKNAYKMAFDKILRIENEDF